MGRARALLLLHSCSWWQKRGSLHLSIAHLSSGAGEGTHGAETHTAWGGLGLCSLWCSVSPWASTARTHWDVQTGNNTQAAQHGPGNSLVAAGGDAPRNHPCAAMQPALWVSHSMAGKVLEQQCAA